MADLEERQRLLGDEDRGSGPGRPMLAICDPSRLLHRLVVLFFMCFLGFGSYFCYDNPAALQSQVIQDLHLTTADFMQLYAWYSWPNVVLCFFGGFLLDRVFGVRLGTIIFSLFVCAGQVVFAAGAWTNQFWLMEAGRFIFGIGGESLAVAQNTYAVNWFKGKELNLVFGLQLSMARVGSTVNMNIMGWIYNRVTDAVGSPGHAVLGASLLIAAITCVFSLVCALVLGFLDKRAERILNKEQEGTAEVIKITDVKHFPAALWLIFIVCVGYYVAVFPFIGLGQVFFIEKFSFSPAQARAVNSIVYIISAPASPVLGFMVDKTGRNVYWVLLAVAATLAAHMMLAFTFWNPWIAMSLLGVSYSLLACALWPMVAFVVPEHQLGTAYGFMQSIQNLGLAIISIAAGAILDSKGYLVLEVFFCACICGQYFYVFLFPFFFFFKVLLDTCECHCWLCLFLHWFSFHFLVVGLIAAVLLYFVDYIKGGDLNLSAAARAKLSKEASSDAEKERQPSKPTQGELARLAPMSAFGLRNRYLSRLGAQIPDHFSSHLSSLAYRSVLK
uniref:Lysosomal dipeptide transporter MFSD1 n=2 Tax=Astatotilapia calliptera TaxID=8154 RepID=A0A3P8PXN3_ASTCA